MMGVYQGITRVVWSSPPVPARRLPGNSLVQRTFESGGISAGFLKRLLLYEDRQKCFVGSGWILYWVAVDSLLSEKAIEETEARFPQFQPGAYSVTPIGGGLSGRRFYRLSKPNGESLILVDASDNAEAARRIAWNATMLKEIGVRCVKVYDYDKESHYLWMEDLGDRLLTEASQLSWPERRRILRSLIEQLAILHKKGRKYLRKQPSVPEWFAPGPFGGYASQAGGLGIPFFCDAHQRFMRCYVCNVLGMEEERLGREFNNGNPKRLSELDARQGFMLRHELIHTDIHSGNVIINKAGEPVIIDLDEVRYGPQEYDLATVLFCPGLMLGHEEREMLLLDYFEICEARNMVLEPDFLEMLSNCVFYRSLYAIGVTAEVKKTTLNEFDLSVIQFHLHLMNSVLRCIPGMDDFQRLVQACISLNEQRLPKSA